jgi:uncharacterized protein (UPF0333 family)
MKSLNLPEKEFLLVLPLLVCIEVVVTVYYLAKKLLA